MLQLTRRANLASIFETFIHIYQVHSSMPNRDDIVLVNADGHETGTMEKIQAHQAGVLHRAFSILIVNDQGELLLQQRSAGKYHSAGLWSNACCSHPAPEETVLQAAHRRLLEELDFDCDLEEIFAFTYWADVGNGLIEHEYDHVLLGRYDGSYRPNPDEIDSCKWLSLPALADEIWSYGSSYTYWLKLIIQSRLPELTRRIELLVSEPRHNSSAVQ